MWLMVVDDSLYWHRCFYRLLLLEAVRQNILLLLLIMMMMVLKTETVM